VKSNKVVGLVFSRVCFSGYINFLADTLLLCLYIVLVCSLLNVSKQFQFMDEVVIVRVDWTDQRKEFLQNLLFNYFQLDKKITISENV